MPQITLMSHSPETRNKNKNFTYADCSGSEACTNLCNACVVSRINRGGGWSRHVSADFSVLKRRAFVHNQQWNLSWLDRSYCKGRRHSQSHGDSSDFNEGRSLPVLVLSVKNATLTGLQRELDTNSLLFVWAAKARHNWTALSEGAEL